MKKGEFEPLETPEALTAVAGLQIHVVFGLFLSQVVSSATKAEDGN